MADKQTAVEYLLEQLDIKKDGWNNDVIDKAKAMEKEQIMDAYNKNPQGYNHTAEQYYNETFKSE